MSLLDDRFAFSSRKIGDLRARLSQDSPLIEQQGVCVYITGSFARGEASQFSDLDVFFLESAEDHPKLSETDFTLIKADLIRAAKEIGFPPFSRDGHFLKVHDVGGILKVLGSPEDDYSNCFTARMLLLLESQWLFNESVYTKALERFIGSYLRDYHEHRHTFFPLFLINDIQRYWRTMCLNYEHRRNRDDLEREAKMKNHLKNLRLKFSRMLTCFSAIISLSSRAQLSEAEIVRILRLRPIQRLENLNDAFPLATEPIRIALREYEWFLDRIACPDSELISWISEKVNRVSAFKHAEVFAESIYSLIDLCVEDQKVLRSLII